MQDSPVNVTFALSPYHVPVPLPLIHSVAALQKAVKAIGNTALLFEIIPHCCYATPKAHQYFPLPPLDAPIFIPDIETL